MPSGGELDWPGWRAAHAGAKVTVGSSVKPCVAAWATTGSVLEKSYWPGCGSIALHGMAMRTVWTPVRAMRSNSAWSSNPL